MPQITVTATSGDAYLVVIDDGSGTSRHRVTAAKSTVEDLGGGAAAEDLITASFRFLLERESKDSILSSFALPTIGHYFPEYPDEIRRRMTV